MSDVEDPPQRRPRVLVIFGSIPLFGHERANIAVFSALKGVGIASLFATDEKWGPLFVQPFLETQGLDWVGIPFAGNHRKGMGPVEWMKVLGRTVTGAGALLRAARTFRPTHLYVSNETYFLNMLGALLLTRRPLVYRMGDSPRQHRLAFRLLWRWVIARRVRTFVCVSRYIRERVRAAGVDERKLRVIYSHPLARHVTEEDRRKLPAHWPEGITIAYVGQVTADKGLAVLAEAAVKICAKREDVRFLIAGDYSWQNPFAEAIIEGIRAGEFADRILFLGTTEAVPDLLERSDIHVCPSIWQEPLANVILEAKEAGVPSVVFPVGGLPEVIEHRVDGYICSSVGVAELQEGLEYFMEDSRRRALAGAAARSSLGGKFGYSRFRDEWAEVFLMDMDSEGGN